MYEIFNLLASNNELVKAYPLAIIVVMGYSYRPMYWACISRLGFEEKTNQLWKISMIGGLLNVGLNIIFIPFWGVYGSAIATFIGLMYIGFSGFYNETYKMLNKEDYYPLLWLLSIVILGVITYILKDASIYIKTTITIVTLSGLFLFLLKKSSTFKFLLSK